MGLRLTIPRSKVTCSTNWASQVSLRQRENFKSSKRNPHIHGKKHKVITGFSAEILQIWRKWGDIVKVWKGKKIANQEYFILWGTWVAQSVKRLTFRFSSGYDLAISWVQSSPLSGSALATWSLLEILFLPISLPLLLLCCLCLSQNKF